MYDKKYKEAIKYLDEQYAYFVTHILNIGKPRNDGSIPTAAVAVDINEKDTSKFRFVFNPEFAKKLDVSEYAFILAHETMHVLLNHLNLVKFFENKEKWNCAADICINDYLINAGLKPPTSIGVLTGIPNVGYNAANATVSQVYNDLPDSPPIGIQIDDHTWIHIPGWAAQDFLKRILKDAPLPSDLEDLKDDIDAKSEIKKFLSQIQPGTGTTGIRNFLEDNSVSMAWAKLLQKIDPNIFIDYGGNPPRPSFHRRPKKLGGFPKIILPVKQIKQKSDYGEKKKIVMALDTSGSIGDEQANYFINLARSVVKTRLSLEAITFTTEALELDLENPSFQSGGTDFGPIEKWIQEKVIKKNKDKYPENVVVITDGCANFSSYKQPKDEYRDRWFWLLTGSYFDADKFTNQFFGEAALLDDYVN